MTLHLYNSYLAEFICIFFDFIPPLRLTFVDTPHIFFHSSVYILVLSIKFSNYGAHPKANKVQVLEYCLILKNGKFLGNKITLFLTIRSLIGGYFLNASTDTIVISYLSSSIFSKHGYRPDI